ncbi:hypothetical protein [Thermoleophilum album]|uniref:hypothetical protein n=1 Tax=Thermoleophilum album TaxID=29539 RepID=UPI00115FCBBB|nr:hypothetical protein [Thermoleophilum album]
MQRRKTVPGESAQRPVPLLENWLPRRRGARPLIAALVAAALGAYLAPAAAVAASADLARARTASRAPPQFLSFAIDIVAVTGGEFADPNSSVTRTFPPYDFGRPVLVRLAKALTAGRPAYLRIGGTQADHTYYDLTNSLSTPPPGYERILTRRQWDAAHAG